MFDKFLMFAKAACFIAIALAAFMLAELFHETTKTMRQVPLIVHQEMELTRQLVDARLESIENKADDQLTGLRKDATRQIGIITTTADNRLAGIQADAREQIATLVTNTTKNSDILTTGASEVLATYNAVPTQLRANLDPYTNCEENEFCWQNLMTDSMVAFRATNRDLSKMATTTNMVLPQIASDVKVSSNAFATQFPIFINNTTEVAENINNITKPKWYDRLIGYGLTGTTLWFNVSRTR